MTLNSKYYEEREEKSEVQRIQAFRRLIGKPTDLISLMRNEYTFPKGARKSIQIKVYELIPSFLSPILRDLKLSISKANSGKMSLLERGVKN